MQPPNSWQGHERGGRIRDSKGGVGVTGADRVSEKRKIFSISADIDL